MKFFAGLLLIMAQFPTNIFAQGIEFVELDKAVKDPQSVSYLRLSQNYAKTDSIIKEIAPNLTELKYLQIQTNNLRHFPEDLFFLPKLDTIALADDIYPCQPLYEEYQKFRHLKCVMISTSNMYSFPRNLLGISTLNYLHINAPRIKKIKKEDLNFRIDLKVLSLILPKAKNIPGNIFGIPSLVELSISALSFESTACINFEKLEELKKLSLFTYDNIEFAHFFENFEKSNVELLELRSSKFYSMIPIEVYAFKKIKKLTITIKDPALISSKIEQLEALEEITIFYKKKTK